VPTDQPREGARADATLTPITFAVFCRVPPDWFELDTVVREIGHAVHVLPASVRKRLARLRELGLVEQRTAQTIDARIEIRKRRR
jgi:hypothetical protein